MPKPSHVPLNDLLQLAVEEFDRSISQPNILSYVPYPEQQRFHESEAEGRYIAGGNRGGKTDAIVVEAIWLATNTHPYRERPTAWGHRAIQLRFIVVDVEKGVNQIILPKLKRWTAASMLIDGSFDKSWNSQGLIFTFANGSTIDFLTHGMELDKHGGVPRHAIFFDEEPPQNIFNENMMRLIDYDGWWVIAATPVRGMGWTFDLLWEPVENAIKNDEPHEVDIFTLSAAKNPYLKAQDRTRFMVGMSKEEREIREEGKFVARAGLVFPQFAIETHVIDADAFGLPPKNWEWYSSADVGWRHPTAWLWHAVSPNGDIVTFAEHYASEMTVAEHAVVLREREASFHRTAEPIRIGDPAMKQVTGAVGTSYLAEYANEGFYIGVEGIPHDVMIGVEKMQQYFRVQPKTGWGTNRPRWVISSNCVNLIRELKKLRWAAYASEKVAYEMKGQEKIHKKDDDAFDSARYFATLMPDLSGDGKADEPVKDPDRIPTTIPFSEMISRLRDDDTVTFHSDNEVSEVVEWETTESWSEYA